MKRLFLFLSLLSSVLCFLSSAMAAPSAIDGRWRYDKTRSTALDGWHEWDLVITTNGNQVSLQNDMKWGRTAFSATNVLNFAAPASVPNFFRVEQRHMAVYNAKGGAATARASWLDGERTLRVEADLPVEISQGQATMRLYSEYRLLEGDDELLLIELHSSRPKPLVYRFTKVTP